MHLSKALFSLDPKKPAAALSFFLGGGEGEGEGVGSIVFLFPLCSFDQSCKTLQRVHFALSNDL